MRALGDAEPRQAGRYRLLTELGQGGMGRVFLGYGPDGRLVAVKQVRASVAEEDGFLARFRQEVAASRTVSGAYTAAVVDADTEGATPWLASVFVPGPALQDAVDVTGVLPERPALRLAAGLAAALAEIHRAGLVHRDLKPSNVLLTADGVRVIDFGIARAVDGENTRLTRSGWLIGSPGYMSPEQAEGGELTAASDVFSLGSVLVMACTGASPFAGPSTPRTLYNVVHAEPDLTAVPESVRRIAALCLAKDPADRPTPDQLLTEIGEITPSTTPWPRDVHRMIDRQHAEVAALLDGTPAEETVVAPPKVATTTMPVPGEETVAVRTEVVAPAVRRRRRWLIPALALVVVAAVAAWLVVWWPWSGEEERQDGLVPLTDDAGLVTGMRVSPDGATLAITTYAGNLVLWDLADGRQIDDDAAEDASYISAVAFSRDGELMATASYRGPDEDATVRWWDVATWREVGSIDFPTSVSTVLFGPDDLLVTRRDGVVQTWDLTTKQASELRPGSTVLANAVAISPDGTKLATADTDDAVRLWDLAGGQQIGDPLAVDCDDWTSALAFSPDSTTLAVGDGCGTTTLWDVARGERTGPAFRIGDGTTQDAANDIVELAFSPDGTVVAAADDKVVRLWEVASGDAITPPQVSEPGGLAFVPDSRTLIVSESYHRVWRYEVPA